MLGLHLVFPMLKKSTLELVLDVLQFDRIDTVYCTVSVFIVGEQASTSSYVVIYFDLNHDSYRVTC